ncbi:(2Fe-2S)-binding protein [Geothrix fuzhouensis]|uniref:(2Fe-2S)-binding protein n=1 Tax=Geothrix fuzhouensis TaxID=2966451 RepID=UPI002147D483|nr:(2Fe-2S)-binding protein [Geothrix fuzhouensis]
MARTHRADLIIGGRGSLMNRCLAAGLPVASACSGQGVCARCMITTLEGGTHLSPPRPHETKVLERHGAGPEQRLSCQCRIADPSATVLITTGYW